MPLESELLFFGSLNSSFSATFTNEAEILAYMQNWMEVDRKLYK
jgi:hypothetical protein